MPCVADYCCDVIFHLHHLQHLIVTSKSSRWSSWKASARHIDQILEPISCRGLYRESIINGHLFICGEVRWSWPQVVSDQMLMLTWNAISLKQCDSNIQWCGTIVNPCWFQINCNWQVGPQQSLCSIVSYKSIIMWLVRNKLQESLIESRSSKEGKYRFIDAIDRAKGNPLADLFWYISKNFRDLGVCQGKTSR